MGYDSESGEFSHHRLIEDYWEEDALGCSVYEWIEALDGIKGGQDITNRPGNAYEELRNPIYSWEHVNV